MGERGRSQTLEREQRLTHEREGKTWSLLSLRVVWGAVGARRGERPECEGPRGAVFTSTLGFLLEAGCQPLTEVRVSGILSWFSDRFRIGRELFTEVGREPGPPGSCLLDALLTVGLSVLKRSVSCPDSLCRGSCR